MNFQWIALSLPLVATAHAAPTEGYRLAWHDEFDGQQLDPAKWVYRMDSKHWSTQNPANVVVADGNLYLGVKKEAMAGKEYTGSGVISTSRFLYGYYEARLRVPPGAGWHTSFWLMNYDQSYGTGTKSANQEIDICEQDSVDRNSYIENLHDWSKDHINFGAKKIPTGDLSADFHVFGCEFTRKTIRYYFDGQLVQERDATALINGLHNIWLTTIASHLGHTEAVDDTKLPSAAVVDYVRFYEPANGEEGQEARHEP